MSWLRLELRLLRRDLLGLGMLSALILTVAWVRPQWGESLAQPVAWLFVAVVLYGALRWAMVAGEVGALAAVAPVKRGWIETVGFGLWLGVSAMLAVAFASAGSWGANTVVAAAWLWVLAASAGLALTGSWAGICTIALAWPLVRGGPTSLTLGTYSTWTCMGVCAALLLLIATHWLRGVRRQELLPNPTPKTVRPMKTHVEHGKRGKPRSPRASLRLFFDPRGQDAGQDGLLSSRRWGRLLVDAAIALLLAVTVSGPAAGLSLGLLGLSVALFAVSGVRALLGWPISGWRVLGLNAWGPVLWLVVGLVVLSSQWNDKPVNIVHRVGLLADSEVRAALARMPDAPPSVPAAWRDDASEEARPQHWPLRWNGVRDLRWEFDQHLVHVHRRLDIALMITGASPFDRPHRRVFDEPAEYGEAVSLYLKVRFGITRDPAALADELGDGYDLDRVLEVGPPWSPNEEACVLASEIPIPLYPWKRVPKRWRDRKTGQSFDGVDYERVEDLSAVREAWAKEKKDGRVFAFGPALRRLEKEIQPEIRQVAWELRATWVVLLLFAFALGLRAGVAYGPGIFLYLAAAALLPATWLLLRWQPLGIELVAFAHRQFPFVLAALLMALVFVVFGVVRAWRRRILAPAVP